MNFTANQHDDAHSASGSSPRPCAFPPAPTCPLERCPEFPNSVARFEAWWQGELIDRPPVTLTVLPGRPYRGPTSKHATARDRWLDVEYQVEHAIAELARYDFVGDRFPIYVPDVGPELAGTLLGCELEFGEHTSWSLPIIENAEQWSDLLDRQPDFTGPSWQAIEAMTDLALERSQGRFLVGVTDLHGAFDTMAALRDPQRLCLDLVDAPERLGQVSRHLAGVFREAFDRLWSKIRAAGMGCTTWTPLYHGGPAYLPSCDFWCMLSTAMAREVILPSILEEMTILHRTLFHLDGPQALRHLNLLLALPQLDAIQWVYGDGHGQASDWLDIYRQIITAGKSVQVIASSPDDALVILRALGPHRLWLTISEPFSSIEQASAFLREIEQSTRTASAIHSGPAGFRCARRKRAPRGEME